MKTARAEDLVILGVRWSGFRLEHDVAVAASRPRLVAEGGDARVVLTFPPPAGPSHVQFKVPAGTSVELSAEGVLEALGAAGKTVLSSGSGPGEEPTAIERSRPATDAVERKET